MAQKCTLALWGDLPPVEVFVRGVPTDSLRREEPEAKSYVQQRKGVTRADLGSFRGQKHTSGEHNRGVSYSGISELHHAAVP